MEKIRCVIDTLQSAYYQTNEEHALRHFNGALISFIFENFPLIIIEHGDIFYRSLIIQDAEGPKTFKVKAFFSNSFNEKMNEFYPEYCI